MTPTNDDQISVLNGLIETTLDSGHGYGEAAKEAKNARFKTLFESRAVERQRLTTELQTLVRGLGGGPRTDGTMLASAHRMFLNLKSMVTGSDESVVNEVESGEDFIKGKFETALKDETLSAPVKASVMTVYASIKADHDKMRDLKHSMQAAH